MMSTVTGTGSAGGVSSVNMQGMDLETMMMMVQSQRAEMLETQLKDQIASVQKKNEQIGKFNDLLGALNAAAGSFGAEAKAGDKINFPSSIERAAKTAGVSLPSGLNDGGKMAKGKLDSFIQQVKSNIDSFSNSQQMDMLRLQSLSNKRNEAFETMTNFMKKMQDSRNSIIGNMR